MSAVSAYLICNTLELVTPSPQATLFFAALCHLFIGGITVGWFAFALVLSNRKVFLTKPAFHILWLIPLVTVALAFTNSSHHLLWKDYVFLPEHTEFLYMRVISYGAWFWIEWLQSYILVITGAFLMVWSSIPPHKTIRTQSRSLAIGALLPLGVNLIYVLHLIPGLLKDYSALGYAISGIFLAVSIFRHRLLNLTPLARTILIDNMHDGMLTLDLSKRVADYNPAALWMLSANDHHPIELGEPFPLLDTYIQSFETNPHMELLQTELKLAGLGEDGYFDMQIRRIRGQIDQEEVGYLVFLHSISDHVKLLQTVRKQAEEDWLTGVHNRSRFDELARLKIEDAKVTSQACSILMMDIDHFKEVNDSLGHRGGDQLLQAFALRLGGLMRKNDLLGRIGGDEFIVLLPDTSLENGRSLAERICRQIALEPLDTQEFGKIPITISIGISAEGGISSEPLETIVNMADKALYRAKTLGRNRVCVSEPVRDVIG